jgi:hypothetical protein
MDSSSSGGLAVAAASSSATPLAALSSATIPSNVPAPITTSLPPVLPNLSPTTPFLGLSYPYYSFYPSPSTPSATPPYDHNRAAFDHYIAQVAANHNHNHINNTIAAVVTGNSSANINNSSNANNSSAVAPNNPSVPSSAVPSDPFAAFAAMTSALAPIPYPSINPSLALSPYNNSIAGNSNHNNNQNAQITYSIPTTTRYNASTTSSPHNANVSSSSTVVHHTINNIPNCREFVCSFLAVHGPRLVTQNAHWPQIQEELKGELINMSLAVQEQLKLRSQSALRSRARGTSANKPLQFLVSYFRQLAKEEGYKLSLHSGLEYFNGQENDENPLNKVPQPKNSNNSNPNNNNDNSSGNKRNAVEDATEDAIDVLTSIKQLHDHKKKRSNSPQPQ